MLRSKRHRFGECEYGCCKTDIKRSRKSPSYRAKEKRQWRKMENTAY